MAHQYMPKIFHGPHKNPPASPPTYLMYSPLFLCVTYSVFIVTGVRHLFILVPHLHIHEVPTKHPQEMILDPRNTHGKTSGPTKYPREKILDARNIHEKIFRTQEAPTGKNSGPSKARGTIAREPTMARDPSDLAHSTHTWSGK